MSSNKLSKNIDEQALIDSIFRKLNLSKRKRHIDLILLNNWVGIKVKSLETLKLSEKRTAFRTKKELESSVLEQVKIALMEFSKPSNPS